MLWVRLGTGTAMVMAILCLPRAQGAGGSFVLQILFNSKQMSSSLPCPLAGIVLHQLMEGE